MPASRETAKPAKDPAHEAPLSKGSRRLLQLSLATPRPCPWGPNCICLTLPEGRALRRVGRIVRQWRRRKVRRERMLARAHAQAMRG